MCFCFFAMADAVNDSCGAEHQLTVRIREDIADEEEWNPKFSFGEGEELVDEFTDTNKSLAKLRLFIEEGGCSCIKALLEKSKSLWKLLHRVSMECFWKNDFDMPTELFCSSSKQSLLDVPLWFDVLGLLFLDLQPGQSFLHINSGTGYGCTLASVMLGPNCANHGVEFRHPMKKIAQKNLFKLIRFHPHFALNYSLPMYHSQYPLDLFVGRGTKFDRVLVTDCFKNLQDFAPFKCLLKRGGRLVTGYYRDEEKSFGFAVVREDSEKFEKENIQQLLWECPCVTLHQFKDENLKLVILHVMFSERRSFETLLNAIMNVQPEAESGVRSLKELATEACYRFVHPFKHLLGDLRSQFFLRKTTRYRENMRIFGVMRAMTDVFLTLRSRCLTINEDSCDEETLEDLQGMLDEFGRLIDRAHVVASMFTEDVIYKSWKFGLGMHLPWPCGIMIWLIENVTHVTRYYKINHCRCCFVAEAANFDTCLNIQGFQKDKRGRISIPPFFISAIIAFFKNTRTEFLEIEEPWNYQMTKPSQIRRILTKLSARLCTDAAGMISILHEMKTLCERQHGGRGWCDPVVDFNLTNCQLALSELCHRMVHESQGFTSINICLEAFSELIYQLRRLHYDACFLIGRTPNNRKLAWIFNCFRCFSSSAFRNPIGGKSVKDSSDPQLEWMSAEGTLIDPRLFQTERAFLSRGYAQDMVPIDDVWDVVIYKLMSDLKEIEWMAFGSWADNQLAYCEENFGMNFYIIKEVFSYSPFLLNIDCFGRVFRRGE